MPSPNAPSSVASAVDVASLRDRVAGHLPLLRELLTVFQQQYPTQIARIRETSARRDAEELRKAAHRLIGTLACFSATRAVAAARAVEHAAATGAIEAAIAGVAAVEREVSLAESELSALAEQGFEGPRAEAER